MALGRIHTTTKELFDFLEKQLTSVGLEVVAFPVTKDIEEVFSFIPFMQLPSAIVMYEGSSYKGDPNRVATFSVLLTTKYEVSCKTAIDDYLNLLDRVINAIDYQVESNVKWTIVKDDAFRLDKHSMTCSVLIRLEAEDM